MEIQESHVLLRNKNIILSWTTELDPEKIENIKVEGEMITYTYEWTPCMCENKLFEECKRRALNARMAEIQYEIDKTLTA